MREDWTPEEREMVERVERERRELRAALKAKGWTFKRFAAECGCSASNISSICGLNTWHPVPVYVWRKARELGIL